MAATTAAIPARGATRAVGRATVPIRRQTTPPDPEPSEDAFRAWLRKRMTERGYESVAALARAADIDASNLSRWLSGTTEPAFNVLTRLEEPLKVTLGELLVRAYGIAPKRLGMGAPPVPSEVKDLLDEIEDRPMRESRAVLDQVRQLTDFYRTIRRVSLAK